MFATCNTAVGLSSRKLQSFALAIIFAICKGAGMDTPLTPTDLASRAGISLPYASQILGEKRTPSRALAIRIYRTVGVKFAPIAHLSDVDIDALSRIDGLAA